MVGAGGFVGTTGAGVKVGGLGVFVTGLGVDVAGLGVAVGSGVLVGVLVGDGVAVGSTVAVAVGSGVAVSVGSLVAVNVAVLVTVGGSDVSVAAAIVGGSSVGSASSAEPPQATRKNTRINSFNNFIFTICALFAAALLPFPLWRHTEYGKMSNGFPSRPE